MALRRDLTWRSPELVTERCPHPPGLDHHPSVLPPFHPAFPSPQSAVPRLCRASLVKRANGVGKDKELWRGGTAGVGLRAVNTSRQLLPASVCDRPPVCLCVCLYVRGRICISACVGSVVRWSLCVHVCVCTHTPSLLLQYALCLVRTSFIAATAEPSGPESSHPSHTLTSMLLWHDSSLSSHPSPSPGRWRQ